MNPKATFFFVALSAPLLEKIMILPMLFGDGNGGLDFVGSCFSVAAHSFLLRTVCRNTGWNIVPCAGGVRIQHAVFFWPHGGGKFFLMQKWRRGFFPVKITLVLTMTPLYRIHLHPLWKAERARM